MNSHNVLNRSESSAVVRECFHNCIVFYVKLLQLEYVPSELQGVTSPLSYGLLYCTVDMVST